MISIIVPIFNSEFFLSKCIESVISQSFPDWELILVNDGSTDASADICLSWAKKCKKIKYIEQSNCGRSSARNKGIESAQGEWICFLDSDDVLPDKALEKLASKAGPTVDGVWGSYKTGYSQEIIEESLMKTEEIIQGILNPAFLPKTISDTPYRAVWGKLYSRAIIISNRIFFPLNLRFGEDALFNLEYLKVARTVAFVSEIVYVYNIEHSHTCRVYSPADLPSLMLFITVSENILSKDGPYKREVFIGNEVLAVLHRAACFSDNEAGSLRMIEKMFNDPIIKSYFKEYYSRGFKGFAAKFCRRILVATKRYSCLVRFERFVETKVNGKE